MKGERALRRSTVSRGGARGGLDGAIAPRRKVKSYFSEIFGSESTPKTVC